MCSSDLPHAHAQLKSVDIQAAASFPGVVAVLTGADYSADGVGVLGHGANPTGAEEWQQPAYVRWGERRVGEQRE